MSIVQRKDEHIMLASETYNPFAYTDFDDLKFIHHALPEIAVQDVKLDTQLLSFKLSSPFFINSMTGGSAKAKEINEKLAIIARETGLAMASGSTSIAFKEKKTKDSFAVIRQNNPNGLVFANIGAGASPTNAKMAVELLEADALQLHVNVPQELVMPEGDRSFYWLDNIKTIVEQVGVPVIVKEVGFGMSRETIKQLIDLGVKAVDVSGTGGSNFIRIENARREDHHYSFLNNWGQSTVISLLEAQTFLNQVDIIASGGIRNALDIVKSLALGAKAVGLSAYFLNKVMSESVEEIINHINDMKMQIQTLMVLLGKRTVNELTKTDLWLQNNVKQWCEVRKIDFGAFAFRSQSK